MNPHTEEGTRDMNAVTAQPEAPVSPAGEAGALIHMIERAATNPAVDIDKMERLFEMRERIVQRDAEMAFNAALAGMQPLLPVIDENGQIKNTAGAVQSTYAEWEDINAAVRPLLAQFGFALSFRPGRTGDQVTVTGVLRHRGGHKEEATVSLSVDGSGSKNNVQAVGSSMSYGKRYAAIALLNITSRAPRDRDDDGNKAGLSGAVLAAQTAIDLCQSAADLALWKKENETAIKRLPSKDADQVVRYFNARVRKVKAEGNGQ